MLGITFKGQNLRKLNILDLKKQLGRVKVLMGLKFQYIALKLNASVRSWTFSIKKKKKPPKIII